MTTSKELLQLEQGTPFYESRLRVCNSEPSSSAVSSRSNHITTSSLESSVLSRVKAFLPRLEAENAKLFSEIKEKGGDDFDIEVLTGGQDMPHVEMDLALGVAELQTPEAVAAAELAVNGSGAVYSQDGSSSGSDSEEENEGGHSEGCDFGCSRQEEDQGFRQADVSTASHGNKSRLISEVDRR